MRKGKKIKRRNHYPKEERTQPLENKARFFVGVGIGTKKSKNSCRAPRGSPLSGKEKKPGVKERNQGGFREGKNGGYPIILNKMSSRKKKKRRGPW